MSTTALHWLTIAEPQDFYAGSAGSSRSGGVVLNGDNMPYDRSRPVSQLLADRRRQADLHDAFALRGVKIYDAWWQEAQYRLEARAEAAERLRLHVRRPRRDGHHAPYSAHVLALSEAQFGEAATI
ncbi:hypothetical protein ACFT8W_03940 [Streptomyces hygroscopicus]|uniref:hypothetical protein n=1 Tax=Streptomyces hygroscopicus TaxID=1912 RepID=UPI00363E14C5